ncbi:tyrosine--tRNA ligase [soil metagenome]
MSTFLADMQARGQVHAVTDENALSAYLGEGDPAARRAYAGFDPTADSLTIGNLVTIMALARFQHAGHTPVVVMGGGTGLIGDPSGKSAERMLLTRETVHQYVDAQSRLIARVLDNAALLAPPRTSGAPLAAPIFRNNADWLGKLSYLDVLRDFGKYFSVNQMIVRDSVRDRLTQREQGISYTEFSYMILQAIDFDHLHASGGIMLQMGGSDQWGNIVSGVDLIRRRVAVGTKALDKHLRGSEPCDSESVETAINKAAFGLTWPLVTKADGGKFGKTESGAIWLTPRAGPEDTSTSRTSAFAYYQFWLNAADADTGRFLRTFTFLTMEEIAELEAKQAANPGAREAQRAVADAATAIVHGPEAAASARSAAAALFSGDLASIHPDMLRDALAGAESSTQPRTALEGEGLALIDLLVPAGLAASKTEARQFLSTGAVTVNGQKAALATRLTKADLLHSELITLRRGKKTMHVLRFA